MCYIFFINVFLTEGRHLQQSQKLIQKIIQHYGISLGPQSDPLNSSAVNKQEPTYDTIF